MKTIYIFRDKGTSGISAQNLKFAMKMALQDWNYNVCFIDAGEIQEGALSNIDKVTNLVIGGGSFTDAKAVLGHKGIRAIQSYIQNGGGYCGVCMGAYGAFSTIDFKGHTPKKGHGLGVFNTTVRGNLDITPPYDGTAHTSTILDIHHMAHNIHAPNLYWGGFDMNPNEVEAVGGQALSSFILPNGTSRILSFKLDRAEQGRPLFLSSYHFEAFTRRMIWQWVTSQGSSKENNARLHQEITSYSEKSYLMGLACALDNMDVVKDFSFAQAIWPDAKRQNAQADAQQTDRHARPDMIAPFPRALTHK